MCRPTICPSVPQTPPRRPRGSSRPHVPKPNRISKPTICEIRSTCVRTWCHRCGRPGGPGCPLSPRTSIRRRRASVAMLQEGVRLLKSPPEGMWTWGGSGREGVSPQTGGAGWGGQPRFARNKSPASQGTRLKGDVPWGDMLAQTLVCSHVCSDPGWSSPRVCYEKRFTQRKRARA